MKKDKGKKSENSFFTYIVIIIFFTVSLMFYLWHHIDVIRAGYKIEEIKKEKKALQEEIRQLKIRRSELMRLDRVDEIAKTKLGLVKVRENEIIVVKNDKN